MNSQSLWASDFCLTPTQQFFQLYHGERPLWHCIMWLYNNITMLQDQNIINEIHHLFTDNCRQSFMIQHPYGLISFITIQCMYYNYLPVIKLMIMAARMRSDRGHWHQYISNSTTRTTNRMSAMAEKARAAPTPVDTEIRKVIF